MDIRALHIDIPKQLTREAIKSSNVLIDTYIAFDGLTASSNISDLNRAQISVLQMGLIDIGLLDASKVKKLGSLDENTRAAFLKFQDMFRLRIEGGAFLTLKTLSAFRASLFFNHMNIPLVRTAGLFLDPSYSEDIGKFINTLKEICSDGSITYAEKKSALEKFIKTSRKGITSHPHDTPATLRRAVHEIGSTVINASTVVGADPGKIKDDLKSMRNSVLSFLGLKEQPNMAAFRLTKSTTVNESHGASLASHEFNVRGSIQKFFSINIPPSAMGRVSLRPVSSFENRRPIDQISNITAAAATYSNETPIGSVGSIYFDAFRIPVGGVCINGETLNPAEKEMPTVIFNSNGKVTIEMAGPDRLAKLEPLHYVQFPLRIIHKGRSTLDPIGKDAASNKLEYDSRTAFGIKADGTIVMFSSGETQISMEELAQALIDLGCVEAVNMDGGFSSQMSFGDRKIVKDTRPTPGGIALFIRK